MMVAVPASSLLRLFITFSSSSSFFRIFCSESESACCGGGGPTAAAVGGGWGGVGPAAGGGTSDWGGDGPAGGGCGPAAAAAAGDAWADDVEDLPYRHSKCHIDQAASATSHHRHDRYRYQHQQPILEQPIVHKHRCHIVEYRGLNKKGVARIKSSFLYYDQQSQKFTEIY